MFDMIGFWGVITAIVFPFAFVSSAIIETFLTSEYKTLKGVSRCPHKGPAYRIQGWFDNSDLCMVPTIYTLIVGCIFLFYMYGEGLTVVQALSGAGMALAGVGSWITTIVLVYLGYTMIVRRVLKLILELKAKVDKLSKQ